MCALFTRSDSAQHLHFVCAIQIMSCIMPSLISGFLFAEEDKIKDEGKNCVEKEINTDPWPGYRYTGKLRPHYPLVRMQHTRDWDENWQHDTHTLSQNKTNLCIQTRSFICMCCFQTPMRLVPSNIQRPDYADHPLGKTANPFTHKLDLALQIMHCKTQISLSHLA